MKKFLSLLLALTLVLSLVVVPARAADSYTIGGTTPSIEVKAGDTQVSTVEKNTELTYTLSTDGLTVSKSSDGGTASVVDSSTYTLDYTWTGATKQSDDKVAKVTPDSAQTLSVSCKIDVKVNNTVVATTTVTAPPVTVTDAFKSAITGITYNGRPCVINGNSLTYYTISSEGQTAEWSVTAPSEYGTPTASLSSEGVLTVTGEKNSSRVTTTYNATSEAATVTLGTPNPSTISKDGTTSITATVKGFTPKQYTWAYTKDDSSDVQAIVGQTTRTLTWTPGAAGTYKVTCTATYKVPTSPEASNGISVTSPETTITVENKTYDIRSTSSPATAALSTVYASSNSAASFPAINLYDVTTPAAPVPVSPAVTFTYEEVSDPSNAVRVDTQTGAITVTGSGTATLRAKTSYKGKTYLKDLTVYASALMADFDRQAWYNSPATYYYSDLVTAATKALSTGNTYGSNYYYGTVNTIQTVSVNNNSLGTSTNTLSYGAQSGSITFTPYYNARGKAPVTVTLTTTTGKPVTVTLNIPVVPIPRTFDSLTAEPVTTNYTTSINNYRITFPSTYSTYYVVQKNGMTAPDYATVSLGNPYSAGSQYTLSSADFGTNGTCTLYVIATNNYTYGSSYGMYYSGAITVSQTNYNINYNGVAGETVQFKHADFTNFMNEVSQARGDASKTGSYPYVTFNYVTFNYPTSTQGTLYYNGTAMSNSSYSGSFNSRTQITNLDNVTFVPYARTSAKSIPLTFTLSVTKYGANGAVVNRDLKYTGTVVVSIVREDIKYTAAPGDTIRFTDSDFLNYLRTQNGFNSNYYSIDYVTFDQSAVNALNEGVLYAYSTGFNAVKTTDKFYYTTTSYNQNALSDVTFRASAYAKTGTTVYIPFTIYARYGTTGTGTRQVSGTVAIKLAQTMNFVDVKTSDYFYDSVKWAVNSNITKGTSATTFSPYKTCTRAEIVTFLWRAAGSKTPTITRNPFTDVAPSMGMDYYYAILWASQNGIAAGTSATTFSPNATCTRAQIVTFLWRYSNKPAGYYSNPFTDVNKAEHAAYYDAILWAVGKGITKGTTATTFSPYGTCTRGEAVTFLYRAVNGK